VSFVLCTYSNQFAIVFPQISKSRSIWQEVNVRVWDNSECAANYKKLSRDVISTMLCAGEMGNDACQVGTML
jgi:secreted trypsin-like serine protease